MTPACRIESDAEVTGCTKLRGPPPTSRAKLKTRNQRTLRQIAHHLDPVVTIGNHGTSDTVMAELERALRDHELIKVRIHDIDREQRRATIATLVAASGAELVQSIGKIVVLYRANPEANPDLSNVRRAGVTLG